MFFAFRLHCFPNFKLLKVSLKKKDSWNYNSGIMIFRMILMVCFVQRIQTRGMAKSSLLCHAAHGPMWVTFTVLSKKESDHVITLGLTVYIVWKYRPEEVVRNGNTLENRVRFLSTVGIWIPDSRTGTVFKNQVWLLNGLFSNIIQKP